MTTADARAALTGGMDIDTREERLTDGADSLSGERRSILSHPQFLITAAATLMTMGITAVLLGWYGAAHTTIVEQQVPYLISGGLLGVALATIGALLLFTHWLTVSIREARQREVARLQDEAARREEHSELLRTLEAIHGALAGQGELSANGSARGVRPTRRAPRSQ